MVEVCNFDPIRSFYRFDMANNYRYIILILLVGFFYQPIMASDTLYIDGPVIRTDLSSYSELYIDSTGELTIDALLQSTPDFTEWMDRRLEGRYPNAYWLHIPVVVREDFLSARILVPGEPGQNYVKYRTDYFDLFVVDRDGEIIQKERTGGFVPRSEKSLSPHPLTPIVPIAFTAGERLDIYVRIQNVYRPQVNDLHLELKDAAAGAPLPDYSNTWLLLGPWGMFIIIGIYVMVFYYYVRDRSFLYFGFFCLFYSLDLYSTEVLGGMINLIPEHPTWLVQFFYAHLFSLTFLMLFGWRFIDVKKNFPVWSRYYKLVLMALFSAHELLLH